MALRVDGGVAPVAVRLVYELLGDLGAAGPRPLEVRVDVLDVDVKTDGFPALLLRVPVALARVAHEDVRVAELHFGVVDVTLLARVAQLFLEAERA